MQKSAGVSGTPGNVEEKIRGNLDFRHLPR